MVEDVTARVRAAGRSARVWLVCTGCQVASEQRADNLHMVWRHLYEGGVAVAAVA